MNKQITITGTIFHRTRVESVGEGNQGRGFITIEVEKEYTDREGNSKTMYQYYQPSVFRRSDILDVRVGYKVEADIEVEGSLWREKDTKEPKMGNQNLFANGAQISFEVPRVFPSMTLKSMTILETNDLETTSLKNEKVAESIANEPDDSDLPF